ncbi:MAG: hypothetical protein LUD48_06095 [Prevotella sp.]|nr:hypothetical protein [Prevotella sp.]
MRRAILLLIITLSSSVLVQADEIRSIKLDNNYRKGEMVSLPYCNIFVELNMEDSYDDVSVTVKMENITEGNILYLFDRSYDEKTLKKMSIVYDKVFHGTKGKRITDECEGIGESLKLSPSSEKILIKTYSGESETMKCRLPIYIALKSGKSKVSLAQKEVIELDIDVNVSPDSKYYEISNKVDQLTNEINHQTFCTNKNHRGIKSQDLIKQYEDRISGIRSEVHGIYSERGYKPEDKGYKQYYTIEERLDTINLNGRVVTSCKNDKKVSAASHSCRYCSLTYEDIYKKLENYYIDIHNGKKTKDQIMGDVEALYSCATKNKRRTDAGSYLSRISTYYNKIKDM